MYGWGLGTTQQIVAIMPPLPASACNAQQTYIPPGGNMGPQYNNQTTPTGACIDNPAPASTGTVTVCFGIFGDSSGPIASGIPICRNTALGIGAAAVLLFFFFGGRR